MVPSGDGASILNGDVSSPTIACDGSACVLRDATVGYCGDGIVETSLGEQCDDGNSKPGDGCWAPATSSPGTRVRSPGQPCVLTVTLTCGDGKIQGLESCDDGNTTSGDGCSSLCQVEPGWVCPVVDAPCKPVVEPGEAGAPVCGDGLVETGEQCDLGAQDGVSGSGCSATCQIVQGYYCPQPNKTCVSECGDGVVQADNGETCDLGSQNGVAGSGCSATCTVMAGCLCPLGRPPLCHPGGAHPVSVGDGIVESGEQCDLGAQNGVVGSGCLSNCSIAPGFFCDAGTSCVAPPNARAETAPSSPRAVPTWARRTA